MIQDEAAEADALADQVNRLTELRSDPEKYHVARNDIAVRLRRMAKRLRGDPGRQRVHTWRP